jgi:hypothetical protein
MQKVVRDEGVLGAPGRGKDDRVIAAALAHEAWASHVRNQCMSRNMMRPRLDTKGDIKPSNPISPGMAGWLQRIGIDTSKPSQIRTVPHLGR